MNEGNPLEALASAAVSSKDTENADLTKGDKEEEDKSDKKESSW